MNLKVYTERKYDTYNVKWTNIGKSIIIDSATTFYMQLEKTCDEELDYTQKYELLRNVFSRVVEQAIIDCKIALVGFFSKVDYCIKEYKVPDNIASLIHQTRKEIFPESRRRKEIAEDDLINGFYHNLKATTYLVYYLCNKENIPVRLKNHFPHTNRKNVWGKFDEKALRVTVEHWDDKYIWATEEENGTTLQICYSEENKHLTREGNGSWDYLNSILWEGAILNLVRIRMNNEDDICYPELIILEPDYLVNVTTIASCFETYAESPFVNLINKIKPSPNTIHIHLGNLSGMLLDNAVHGKEMSFDDCFKDFVSKNSLNLISCPEFISGVAKFKEEGKRQKDNIEKLINQDLPNSIGEYDKKSVILEPSFFSSTLGIQGRFDFLEEGDNRVIIIEQKSGKGEFIPYSAQNDPNTPEAKEQHKVQALLYRALYQYELSDLAALKITPMLLYSKYSNGLLELPPMPSLFLRAIKIRNLLAWSEYLYANEGMDILATLTPDKLNQKKCSGRLWEEYTKPELSALLSPIHNATPLERTYYLRFLRFIEKEHLLAKVGNKAKENSGFASIWHDTVEVKKAAGNIYDNLVIAGFGSEEDTITSIRLRFLNPQSTDTSNFRNGDIVILYPYKEGTEPDACIQMVNRASIVDIKEEYIELRLRNPQTDKKIFEDKSENTLWAIEHDMFESMTTSLYSAMHSFLSAPKHRKDLILSQRLPEVDSSLQLKGEYDNFNELSLRVKQAKDLFLIIGPPGTGKTSFGLVNILKEQLLEEGSNILLLSYTNRAVDEICSKLVEVKNEMPDFNFIRIGSELSCSPEYRQYLFSTLCSKAESGSEVNKMIRECRVFCGTTSSMNANLSLFALKHFDLAIVDEASQILEPHLIGLFSVCKNGNVAIDKFVLIGDHKQLPAVVQQPTEESVVTDPELNKINLTNCRISLFERLLMQFKTGTSYDKRFVYMLNKQGRMHMDIAEFPNYAFYGNKLGIVPLDHQLLPSKRTNSDNGIIEMLNHGRIIFIESEIPKISSSAKTNTVEAEMIAATVRQIYELSKDSFHPEKTIGIIVPYRNQISTVRNAIDRYGISILHNITIDTVERYQGSQRDYIIFGFTIQQPYQLNFLTNNVFEEDGMLIDRKLNVAMTRARLNLIIIGNPALLNENITFFKMMEFVRSKGCYVSVPTEDYCKGNFSINYAKDINNPELVYEVPEFSSKFLEAFNNNVINPINNHPETNCPDKILGNCHDANMMLINYGRTINQSSLISSIIYDTITSTEEEQVLLFCYYLMRNYYLCAKRLYQAFEEWLITQANSFDGNVHFIDLKCGPATCGLAFYEQFKDNLHLTYTGIDGSLDMRTMGNKMINDVCSEDVNAFFLESIQDLDDDYIESISKEPTLTIFNMAYLFSNIDSEFSEKLANHIIDIMQKKSQNKYIFIIQHSKLDNKLRSFCLFRKRLEDYVIKIEDHQLFNNQLCNSTSKNSYFYNIWMSK